MPAYADPTPTPISADTIFLAFELSGTSWLVALHAPDADKVEHRIFREALKMTGIARGIEMTSVADVPAERFRRPLIEGRAVEPDGAGGWLQQACKNLDRRALA